MKVAAIQLTADDNKDRNIARAITLVKRAIKAKADWILLPEVFNYRGPLKPKIFNKTIAEKIPSSSSTPFIKLARQCNVYILIGSIYEKVNNNIKVYNTSILINNRGKIIARYRKMNLFNAKIKNKTINESKNFLPGNKAATANIRGFKVGLSICYDLRFPELYRKYAKAGCHILTVPSAFTKKTGQAHWETLLRARAIENKCYVIAPNQAGRDNRGIETYGHSMIINPWGKILSKAQTQKEKIIYANLFIQEIKEMKKILP